MPDFRPVSSGNIVRFSENGSKKIKPLELSDPIDISSDEKDDLKAKDEDELKTDLKTKDVEMVEVDSFADVELDEPVFHKLASPKKLRNRDLKYTALNPYFTIRPIFYIVKGVAVLHVPIGYVDPVQENDHRAYDQSKLKIKKNLKMKLILRFHNVEKVLEFADQSFLKRKMKLKIKLKIRHCHRVLDHVRK